MNKASRILTLFISLSLILVFFTPVWDIDLEAPQYPEGLGMKIWVNKMSGDINTINGLNHYIGMKEIHPEDFSELKFMPYIIAFIIGIGLLAAATGKKALLYTWTVIFVAAGIAGGIDFYLWEYDYGTNLDPHAAIKVPGMTYQPPLWGSKVLLNFVAHSYPATGGWVLVIGGTASFLLSLLHLLQSKIKLINTPADNTKRSYVQAAAHMIVGVIVFLTASSCSVEPEPLAYGKEECHHCKMTIVDERFGAEMVLKTGKKYKYDAVECMLHHYQGMESDKQNMVNKFYVANSARPGILIDADIAIYLHSENFPSPMGANISSFGNSKEAGEYLSQYEGNIMTWENIRKKLLN